MGEVIVEVRGMAPVGGGATRWTWRRQLSEAARKQRFGVGAANAGGPFELDVLFFLSETRAAHYDLDNMAKPVLDTLFESSDVQVREPGLTGALFDVQDSQVFRLRLEKIVVASAEEEGIRVTARWH